MKAAKAGKLVAAVEEYHEVGGGMIHWGTIPSKALRAAILQVNLIHQSPSGRRADIRPLYSFPELLHPRAPCRGTADARACVILPSQQRGYPRGGMRGSSIPIASASSGPGGAREEYSADYFLIRHRLASLPAVRYRFQPHRASWIPTRLLGLTVTPRTAVIYGAGVIGCEYGSMLNNMGIDVTLINTRARLLSYLDDEITDALSFHSSPTMACASCTTRSTRASCRLDPWRIRTAHVEVHLKSGKVIKGDVFLFANGRSGNSGDLGLENLHVKPNSRGQIDVNDTLQVQINDAPKQRGREARPTNPPAGAHTDRQAGHRGHRRPQPRSRARLGRRARLL